MIGLLGVVLKMEINVPMSEALTLATVPDEINAAQEIRRGYSPIGSFGAKPALLPQALASCLSACGFYRYAR